MREDEVTNLEISVTRVVELPVEGKSSAKRQKPGKAVCLQGAFTKAMSLGARLVPRSVARKMAMRMNR